MSVILNKQAALDFWSALAQGKWTNDQIKAARFGEGAKPTITRPATAHVSQEDAKKAHEMVT